MMQGQLRGHSLYPTMAQQYVDDRRITGNTRRHYLTILKLLQRRAGPDVRAAEITADHVQDFIEIGDDGRPRSMASQKNYLSVVHSAFSWALDPQVDIAVTSNPAARLRLQKRGRGEHPVRRKTWLGAPQAQGFLNSIRGNGTVPLDIRDAFVVAMYLYTGLRCSELISVRWRDIDFATGVIHVVRKGNILSQVKLTAPSTRLLFEWRSKFIEACGPDIAGLRIVPQVRPVLGNGPIVAGASQQICWARGLTTGEGIRRIVRTRAAAYGIPTVRPHDLRRSFAGMLEDNGADMREIQGQMGHLHMATTERYLEARPRTSAAAEALDFG